MKKAWSRKGLVNEASIKKVCSEYNLPLQAMVAAIMKTDLISRAGSRTYPNACDISIFC